MANAYYWSTGYLGGNSTANIRVTGAELDAALVSAGLSRTADTGQVNWATVNHPGTTDTLIGYSLWPILGGALVMRLEMWSPTAAASTSDAQWKIIVGTGSDGAGNVTGVIYTYAKTGSTAVNAGNWPSYVSNPAAGDFFGLVYKVAGRTNTHAPISFAVEKTVDAAGAADGIGYVITYGTDGSGSTSATAKAAWTIADSALWGPSSICCIVPFAITDSSVGSDKQVFPQLVACNRMRFTHGVGAVVASELLPNTTISACIVGDPATAQRGYACVGYGFGSPYIGNAAVTTYSCVMLWEP